MTARNIGKDLSMGLAKFIIDYSHSKNKQNLETGASRNTGHTVMANTFVEAKQKLKHECDSRGEYMKVNSWKKVK